MTSHTQRENESPYLEDVLITSIFKLNVALNFLLGMGTIVFGTLAAILQDLNKRDSFRWSFGLLVFILILLFYLGTIPGIIHKVYDLSRILESVFNRRTQDAKGVILIGLAIVTVLLLYLFLVSLEFFFASWHAVFGGTSSQ